jgi:hypothetical protein
LGCGRFELAGTVGPPWPAAYVDFLDSTAPNGVIPSYAVAAVDDQGRESALSEIALAIPVAKVEGLRPCVEIDPTDECSQCDNLLTPGVSEHPCRAYRLRWNVPSIKPYHPVTAAQDGGSLGYLMGYHVSRYNEAQASGVNDMDFSALYEDDVRDSTGSAWWCSRTGQECSSAAFTDFSCEWEWESCVHMGQCVIPAAIACDGPEDCISGVSECKRQCSGSTTICQNNGDCPGNQICEPAKCVLTGGIRPCIQQVHCPLTTECNYLENRAPIDPYLIPGPGPTVIYDHRLVHVGYGGNLAPDSNDCPAIRAVYKIYADGNWHTVISGPSDNFDTGALSPLASTARCRVTDSDTRVDYCFEGTTPFCHDMEEPQEVTNVTAVVPTDATGAPIPGKVNVTWTPPANVTDIVGYYIYIRESGTSIRPQYTSTGREFFVTKPVGETTHEFADLAFPGVDIKYIFYVATVANAAKVSRAVASPEVTMPSSTGVAPPVGLKALIWTVNDAGVHGTPLSSNPRSFEGVKLQWKANTKVWTGMLGYRVYRAESPAGPFCALVKSGSTLPFPVCPDSNAYSTTLTTASASPFDNDSLYHDLNVENEKTYFYRVTAVGNSSSATFETAPSAVIEGRVLPHAALPLSPPRHLKAEAPMVPIPGTAGEWMAAEGIYLRWCPNPSQEQVTGYNVYRSASSGGPYERIAMITNPTDPAADCLRGVKRCTINCPTPPCNSAPVSDPGSCTVGIGGTCRLVDVTTGMHPNIFASSEQQLSKVYYYVVTAVRGTEESAYSIENSGWPNYYCQECIRQYERRYDPDNLGDIACDDEIALTGC